VDTNPQLPGSDQPLAGTEDRDVSMPLSVGDFSDEQALDPLAGADSERKFKSSSLLIVLVVVVAVAALISMRTLARVTAGVVGNTEIESLIEKALKDLGGTDGSPGAPAPDIARNGEVLAILQAPYSEQQVKLGDVQKNPFILPSDLLGDEPPVPDNTNDRLREREKLIAETRARFESAGSRLELKSVMMGPNPLANVSGKIVQQGDVIVVAPGDTELTVKEVSADEVILVAEAPELDLVVELSVELTRD
jgi:hypothetical protein